jgi:hypothetical protein
MNLVTALDGYWLVKERQMSQHTVRDYQLTLHPACLGYPLMCSIPKDRGRYLDGVGPDLCLAHNIRQPQPQLPVEVGQVNPRRQRRPVHLDHA